MMPGRTSMKTGRIFRNPAKIVPALAWPSSRAEKDAGPWKVWIGDRFDHVEVVGRDHGAEVREAADASQADDRERDGASNQDESLNGVGINDRGQTAGDGVNPCGDD